MVAVVGGLCSRPPHNGSMLSAIRSERVRMWQVSNDCQANLLRASLVVVALIQVTNDSGISATQYRPYIRLLRASVLN